MSVWEKLFSKITFKDYPDTTTPLDATNLNKMTDAIDGIDDRVVESRNDIIKILGNMATEYDETSTYDVGSYVIHNGLLYKCIVPVEAGEVFDVDKWEKTDCGVEFEIINSQVDELYSNLDKVKLRVGYLTYDGAEGDGLRANLPIDFEFNNTYYAAANVTLPDGYEIHPDFPTIQATINSDSISNSLCISSIARYHAGALIVYLNQNYTGTIRIAVGVRLKKVN